MLFRIALPLLLISFSGYSQTAAPSPIAVSTKTAKIEELFRLMKTDEMQKQMFAQMTASIPAGQRQASSKMMALLAEKMSWQAMRPTYVKLYDDTFTENEISGILMFYESAPGQALLSKMPLLMTNMMAVVQKQMVELKPEIEKLAKEGAPK